MDSQEVQTSVTGQEEAEAEATPFGKLTTWCREIERRHEALRLERSGRVLKPLSTWATDIGYECERRIVYHRVMPWAAKPVGPVLASIFAEGHLHELDVLREIEQDLQLRIRNRSTPFRDPVYDVAGTIDFEVFVPDVGWVPAEVKGLSYIPGDEDEAIDLKESEVDLHRRYFGQLTMYLLLPNVEKTMGVFIFKSKLTGRWKLIAIKLDWDYGEVLLKRAEHVRDATRAFNQAMVANGWAGNPQDGPPMQPETIMVRGDRVEDAREILTADAARWEKALEAASKTLPDRIPNRSECARCPWRDTACHPSEAPIEPALLIFDAELHKELARHVERNEQHREYERLHKKLRARFLETKGDRFLAGDFIVEKRKNGSAIHLKVLRAPGAPVRKDPLDRAEAAEKSLGECLTILDSLQGCTVITHDQGDEYKPKPPGPSVSERIAASIFNSPIPVPEKS